jgi:hypothetical protein
MVALHVFSQWIPFETLFPLIWNMNTPAWQNAWNISSNYVQDSAEVCFNVFYVGLLVRSGVRDLVSIVVGCDGGSVDGCVRQ